MSRTSSVPSTPQRSLENCTSMDPADYKWGSIPPQQQALMNAHFMQMSFFAAFSFPGPMMPYPGCVPPPWMKPLPLAPVAPAPMNPASGLVSAPALLSKPRSLDSSKVKKPGASKCTKDSKGGKNSALSALDVEDVRKIWSAEDAFQEVQRSRFSIPLSEANGSYSTASPPPLQPQLSGISGSLLSSDGWIEDEDGLSAFEQTMEQLNKGMKSVCSFDTLMGLDLLDSDLAAAAPSLSQQGKGHTLKVQGGVSKKSSGSFACTKVSKSGSHAISQDNLGDIFSDFDCGPESWPNELSFMDVPMAL